MEPLRTLKALVLGIEKKKVKARLLDVFFAGVKLSELYEAITEVFEDTEFHWVFAANVLCEFPENRTANEVSSELAQLSPEHASPNHEQLKDYVDNRPYREVTNRVMSKVLQFRVP